MLSFGGVFMSVKNHRLRSDEDKIKQVAKLIELRDQELDPKKETRV